MLEQSLVQGPVPSPHSATSTDTALSRVRVARQAWPGLASTQLYGLFPLLYYCDNYPPVTGAAALVDGDMGRGHLKQVYFQSEIMAVG